jgi:hypothetical protein
MRVMPSNSLWSEIRRTTGWQPDEFRTPIEHLVEFLLAGTLASNAPSGIAKLAEEVLRFDLRSTRVVVLGGGTGLSTIVGGNSQMPDWPDQLGTGVKQEFPRMHHRRWGIYGSAVEISAYDWDRRPEEAADFIDAFRKSAANIQSQK